MDFQAMMFFVSDESMMSRFKMIWAVVDPSTSGHDGPRYAVGFPTTPERLRRDGERRGESVSLRHSEFMLHDQHGHETIPRGGLLAVRDGIRLLGATNRGAGVPPIVHRVAQSLRVHRVLVRACFFRLWF